MNNPTTPLTIIDIQTKLKEIQDSVNELKTEINKKNVPQSTTAQILSLEIDLSSILMTINKISGVDSALESYINSLVIDMKNQSMKDSFYKINGTDVKSTELLKAEIKMIRKLSNVDSDIIAKFNTSIGNDNDADNIKKAITDADNKITF